MLNTLKVLGITLDLSPRPGIKGYYTDLDPDQLILLIDSMWDDYPSCSSMEIAEIVQDLLLEMYPDYKFRIRYHYRDNNFTGRVTEPLAIGIDTEAGTLSIPHIGITIRTLQGAAAAADATRRKWRILLLPSKIVIGEIRLRPTEYSDHPETYD